MSTTVAVILNSQCQDAHLPVSSRTPVSFISIFVLIVATLMGMRPVSVVLEKMSRCLKRDGKESAGEPVMDAADSAKGASRPWGRNGRSRG